MTSRLVGKALIGQSGGPTCVINQSLVGAVQASRQFGDVITGFYGARHGVRGILAQELIDLGAQSDAELEAVAVTPSAALGSVRKKPKAEECERIFRIFQKHDIRYFFYIGGNDSAETAHLVDSLARKAGYDFRVAHIPKTIDNDLLVTDHCPGFGSAARFVAMALMGDNLDNRALGGVKIDVIMGRHAGFLTAATSLGRQHEDDGPHLIYVPEAEFDVEAFCSDVARVLHQHGRCVVAVSEGIRDRHGAPVFSTGEVDSHGNVQLSGSGALGDFLAEQVKKRVGASRVRADTFGYLQRCFPGMHSEVDAREARDVGRFAVESLAEGRVESGSVVIIREPGAEYSVRYEMTELSNVARNTRSLPQEFVAPEGNNIAASFRDYALPLLGELPPIGRLADRVVVPATH